MTSLVVWVAVDQRGPSSAYIATDSRISWPAGTPGDPHWNGARKTYATTRGAHIMGYVGDVLFPALTLPTVTAQLDECPDDETIESAQARVLELVTAAWRGAPPQLRLESQIVHCCRIGSAMPSKFGVQILRLPAGETRWTTTDLQVPAVSSKIEFLGSGRPQLEKNHRAWVKPTGSEKDRTSRAVFSAFCDAVGSGADALTGGAPQLVGLYRQGPGRTFGVRWQGKTYLHGTEVSGTELTNLEYRNSRLERVNSAGTLLAGAQRHANRPT
ncbi:hypothetical protein MUY14_01530 [Amycolatopsis sp. FBCC-B4732]|uniref:hypothetical protein n=1 Tax=Amycolatopsis sp. FBCC-B4732 TaxID=3079339 RepID=UPI001FF5111C|nr:hypothetical protein [Amycolatopsis sp. FBCC-B4732]UOX89351.1 hypothetical protein MUY14_01530 [Amycolatopsis sp. FBCC-B4732]